MRRIAALVLTGAALGAAPASASMDIDVDNGQPTTLQGGCASGEPACTFVLTDWAPQGDWHAPDILPFAAGGVITRLREPFHTSGTVKVQVVRNAVAPEAGDYVVTAAGAPIAVQAGQSIDVPLRLPFSYGEMLAIATADGAGPYDDYEEGGQGPGRGVVAYVHGESDTTLVKAAEEEYDGVSLIATTEPDADGDGFGDETQDHCPGTPGSVDGCTPTAAPAPRSPAPAALVASVRGHRLTYTLGAKVSAVKARFERRAGRRWHVIRTRRLSGGAGTHRLTVPAGTRRVVLYTGSHRAIVALR
jgi:hypothetical protein